MKTTRVKPQGHREKSHHVLLIVKFFDQGPKEKRNTTLVWTQPEPPDCSNPLGYSEPSKNFFAGSQNLLDLSLQE
jgi:hypothetical protein